MPVSESEIKADRDRLRAEYAIKVHKLETQLDQAKLERARHLIDINRRDASISALESNVGQYRSDLEENQNARRVLEQTVTDRLPKVEARLSEAKRLLFNRDREIAELTHGRQEAQAGAGGSKLLHAQQTRADRAPEHRDHHAHRPQPQRQPSPRAKARLRSEVEALRTKTREQAILIDRLQVRLGHGYLLPGAGSDARHAGQPCRSRRPRATWIALRQDLSEAEAALSAARSAGGSEADAIRAGMEREIRGLKARSEDQAGEIARLRAALSAFEQFDGKSIGSLEQQQDRPESQARLRAGAGRPASQPPSRGCGPSWPAAHERLARQAAHFMDEMRRVGAGAVPTSGQVRRPQRISNERGWPSGSRKSPRPSARPSRECGGNCYPPPAQSA